MSQSPRDNDTQAKAPTKTVHFRIQRQDAPGKPAYWEEFEVPYESGANVISCLQWISAHPVTIDGKKTTPPVWEASCLEEVCGACTMLVNGHVRQSCSALIENLIKESGPVITLQPMTKFPLVRDLAVDRQRLFNDLKRIKGWVPIDGTYHLGPGPKETPAQQHVRYRHSECISCGCCLEACPQYTIDNHFVGAAIFGQVRYFNMHETGKELAGDRLEVMRQPGGISDCGNAQNCVKVCPKNIPLTEAIGAVGRQTTVYAIKKFFSGK